MSTKKELAATPEHGTNPDYYYDSYKEFSWKFRVWLIAYGVSVPFIVLNNEKARVAVANSSCGITFLKISLIGVLIQIVMAFAYKCCMWNCDRNARGRLPDDSFWVKWSVWLTENFWVEVAGDLLSLGSFSVSTWELLSIVSKG